MFPDQSLPLAVARDGQEIGQFTLPQMALQLKSGRFNGTEWVLDPSLNDWVPIMDAVKVPPPSPPKYASTVSVAAPEQTTNPPRLILPAVLFWFFLGTLGAHHFYLKNTGRGCAYLACAVLGTFLLTAGDVGSAIGLVCWILLGVGLIFDLIRLAGGTQRDGSGRIVSRWT